jgi:hypothetical protein
VALSFSCQIEVFCTGLIMSFLSEARLTAIHYLSSVIDFACHTTYLLKFEEWYTPDIIIKDKEDKSYLCESEYDSSKFAAFRNVQTGTTSVNYSCRRVTRA